MYKNEITITYRYLKCQGQYLVLFFLNIDDQQINQHQQSKQPLVYIHNSGKFVEAKLVCCALFLTS